MTAAGTTTYELKACPAATLLAPGWECFFGRNDHEFYPLAFYVWIVRGNGLTGLIDTGLPANEDDLEALQGTGRALDPRAVYSEIRPLEVILAAEGLEPGEIDFVLITQTITYHTGGLVPRLQPRAEVYLSRAGMLEFLLDRPGHPPHEFYFTRESWAFLRDLLVAGRLHLVDELTQVVPGIRYETTGGHHPGSAAIQVSTRRGLVGILETAFLQRNLDEELPVGIAENVALCRKTIRRYRQQCDIVLADHEPGILDLFPDGVL